MAAKPYHDGETLRRMYHGEGMSTIQIADEFGCDSSTIRDWMIRNGIDRSHAHGGPPANADVPWRDEDRLREAYHNGQMGIAALADEWETNNSTIHYWLDKYGIETRSRGSGEHFQPRPIPPWQDEGTLRQLYLGEKMSVSEAAAELGCSFETVRKWMHRHGIETRPASDERPPWYGIGGNGYWAWVTKGPSGSQVRVAGHRLLAVAEYGFDAVCGADVHHRNGCGLHNVPQNLEVLSPPEHRAVHHRRRWGGSPWRDEDRLREAWCDRDMSPSEIADEFGCSRTTVRRWVERFGFEH